MLKNYITIAINNLFKNKLYSAINIIGLAIGLAACIVIALYVRDQYSYDKQWKNSDRIYRVNFTLSIPGVKTRTSAIIPLLTMPRLEEYFNGKIEKSTRALPYNTTIDIGAATFKDKLVQVDPAFIDMFQFEIIAGSLENTLTDITNIALSAETANRYFGAKDPINKVLTLTLFGSSIDFKVTAVYRIPGNTVLDIPLLSLLDDATKPPVMRSWFEFNTYSYFKLKDGIDIETLNPLTPAFLDQNIDISSFVSAPDVSASDGYSMDFQNIRDAHLDSPWDIFRASGNKTVVLAFAVISMLVLLIGCINFTILTTAKATQRAREVAMRKVVGAKRKHLMIQFLGESTFIVLLAMILSLGVVEFMLPVFESIVGKSLSLNYTSPSVFLPLLALLFIVSISGGLYPAFVLSGFRPGSILRANQSRETQGSISLRTVLVIFQFSISIALIIATSVIYLQTQYNLNRDPGYNKENLLVINQIRQNKDSSNKIELLKQELINLENVSDVGLSGVQPSQQHVSRLTFTRLEQPENNYMIAAENVGYDYFTTYQIPFIAGRNYSVERDIPDPERDIMNLSIGGNESGELIKRNIIINEKAVGEMGFAKPEEAVGKIINTTTLSNTNYTIIGVIADNHIFSINAPPRAEVYPLAPDRVNVITVRFKDSPRAIMKKVNAVWKKVMGNVEIHTVFVNQIVAQEFEQERTEVKVLISFSLLAIVIACMGLYGSASFTV